MSWEEVCHYIAQGVINIESGYTTIELGSPVHRAMTAFCEYASKGRVLCDGKGTGIDDGRR